MTQGPRTIIYPVTDLPRAKTLYGALLGVRPDMDEPYYVGFGRDGYHVGLDPNGHAQGMTAPMSYWHVDDIRASLERLVDAGAAMVQEVRDVGGGKLIAAVKDADGNVTGLLQSA
jgi:predicted enzyme related to lactoylglutathione lyase